ncbi:DUF3105 domain-containing protein [Streptomyces cavernicola]|uniref:DUF3105 domain-containing protein n=1 Tax=Streptomyces cavernicola TaxID=3043613 RepID=A0ABT6SCS5_9ACTN|nr:DUF3105 domain-containing protein [Streptomyces sp. B-S-A6]MDI3405991.1 DUF3105 domain-containing protein [Streptomyces sp. B-S-A6]
MGSSTTSGQGSSNDRKARIAAMRRAEQARERRNRTVAIVAATAVVAGLVGVGSYLFIREQNEKEREEARVTAEQKAQAKAREEAANATIEGERSWDAKELGRKHVAKPVSYPMTPPVGGDHDQVWMNCNGDVYAKPIPDRHAVHSLEHGAVWVTYNAKAKPADLKALEAKVSATPYSLMSPVNGQKGALMLSAWGKQLTVDSAKDPRVATFFAKYVQGKQTPEPGAACQGGMAQ